MTLETDLHDTFATHEHLAPDADRVLDAVRQRTRRRRPAVRPVAVAATVLAMVAVVVGTVVFATRPGPGSTAAPPASSAPSGAAATTSPPRVHPVAVVPAPLTMPFDVGWLPAGDVHHIARRTQLGAVSDTDPGIVDGEYLLTVTSATRALDVDVQQMPGTLDGVSFKSGPGDPVTVDGRPGVESHDAGGPGGYEVYFLASDNRVVYVNVANTTSSTDRPPASADELRAAGRRVAESVSVPGTTRVQPTFGVTTVPSGMVVRTFEVAAPVGPFADGSGNGVQTAYTIGSVDALDTAISVDLSSLPANGTATPGDDVQGHPTTVYDDGGFLTVLVADAVGGVPIAVSGSVPVADLYTVANGLVLP